MYTQCPACKTVFRLHPDQINAAQGQVRCSRCHTIFNAVDNLFRQPETATAPEEIPATSTVVADEAELNHAPAHPPQMPEDAVAAGDDAIEKAIADTIGAAFPDIEADIASLQMTLADSSGEGEKEAPQGRLAEVPKEPIANSEETPLIEIEAEGLFEQEALADAIEEDETDSPLSEIAFEPEDAQELQPIQPGDEIAQETAEEIDHTAPLEALHPEEETAGNSAVMNEDDSAKEAVHIFADEPHEASLSFQEDEPLEKPQTEEPPPSKEDEIEVAAQAKDEGGFDEELLSIFDEKTPENGAELQLTPEPTSLLHTAGSESLSVEETAENSAAAMSRPRPAETSSWDPFSEENIEALLTASEDNEPLDDGAVFEEERSRDPIISADELDLAAWSDPAPDMEDEEELLSQRLPEDSELDELDLDKFEMSSESQSTDKLPEPETEPHTPTAERPGYSLPLEQEPKRGSISGTLLWGSGIVLMLAGLAMQYLYYHRMALAENAQLRPVLAQMCQYTGCHLPPRRDLAKIELGNHLVQFHPRYVDSLLITATLVNHADFTQPYPIVEVVMTDLEQKQIARRRFLPSDYLVGDNAGEGLRAETEVPLMLEVLDPGKKAVGFEFKFY